MIDNKILKHSFLVTTIYLRSANDGKGIVSTSSLKSTLNLKQAINNTLCVLLYVFVFLLFEMFYYEYHKLIPALHFVAFAVKIFPQIHFRIIFLSILTTPITLFIRIQTGSILRLHYVMWSPQRWTKDCMIAGQYSAVIRLFHHHQAKILC